MLDRAAAAAAWRETSGWPRYEEGNGQQRRSSCPVGMEVITDNIISSCGPPRPPNSPQQFASEPEESVRPLGDSRLPPPILTYPFFSLLLPFLIYCTVALIQTICKFPWRDILFTL